MCNINVAAKEYPPKKKKKRKKEKKRNLNNYPNDEIYSTSRPCSPLTQCNVYLP